MSSLKNFRDIRKKLREKGMKEEDIEKALELEVRIGILDREVFPENPAPLELIADRGVKNNLAMYIPYVPRTKQECYVIFVKILSENLRLLKREIKLITYNRAGKIPEFSRAPSYTWEELLLSLAAHEVRHRIQYNLSIRQFSPQDAPLVDDRLLKHIIMLNEAEFRQRKKIYRSKENRSEGYIREKLSAEEFDASVVGMLVAHKVHRKDFSEAFEEIVSIIKMQAPKKPK